MIKQTKTKIITLSLTTVLGVAAIGVLASNANVLEFVEPVKQESHLELNEVKLIVDPKIPGSTSASDVSWKIQGDKLVTVSANNVDNLKGSTNGNQIQGAGTLSFGGNGNTTTKYNSFVLGGGQNAVNAEASILGASNNIVGENGDKHVVLGSSSLKVAGSENVVIASQGVGQNASVRGNGNIALSVKGGDISANNTMAIGTNPKISHQGSFVFNGTKNTVATKTDFTTQIYANNGLIINTGAKNAQNVDLTINGGLQVGEATHLDGNGALIKEGNCVRLKNTTQGEVGFRCAGIRDDQGHTTTPATPKCGRNAANYATNNTKWKGGNGDFCAQGQLDISNSDKIFRSSQERNTATGIGIYAGREFTYDFKQCFWNPFKSGEAQCSAKILSKTWRCKTPEGNAVVCEANLQIKPMQCAAGTHFEDVNQTQGKTYGNRWECLPDEKTVSCEGADRLNKDNGYFSNATQQIRRQASSRNYTAPEQCILACNAGYHLADGNTRCESDTRQASCVNSNNVHESEWGSIENKTYTETRNSRDGRPTTKQTCRLSCHEGGELNNNKTECVAKTTRKLCDKTKLKFVDEMKSVDIRHQYTRSGYLHGFPETKICDFNCYGEGLHKSPKNLTCVKCEDNQNRNSSTETCEAKLTFECEDIPNAHRVDTITLYQPWNRDSVLLSDDSTEIDRPCRYKCNEGFTNINNFCTRKCKSDQHRDSTSGLCVSNQKTVECTSHTVANGTITKQQVTVTRNRSSWNPTPKCDFTCNNGYKKSADGTTCVTKEAPTCLGLWNHDDIVFEGTGHAVLVPSSATNLTESMTGKLVAAPTGGKCEYVCDTRNGYYYWQNGNTHACGRVPVSCSGNIPSGAKSVPNARDYPLPGDNLSYHHVDLPSDAPCGYVCKDGYKFVKDKCDKIEGGACNTGGFSYKGIDKPYLCKSGTSEQNKIKNNQYTWLCRGKNGGDNERCALPMPSCKNPIPGATPITNEEVSGFFGEKIITYVRENTTNKCEYLCPNTFEPTADGRSCQCPQGTTEHDGICKTNLVCSGDNHRETMADGPKCVSNTKSVDCDDSDLQKPHNGTITNPKVTQVRDKSRDRWSDIPKCELKCGAGYEKKGDSSSHNIHCATLEERYEWKCEQKLVTSKGRYCKPKENAPSFNMGGEWINKTEYGLGGRSNNMGQITPILKIIPGVPTEVLYLQNGKVHCGHLLEEKQCNQYSSYCNWKAGISSSFFLFNLKCVDSKGVEVEKENCNNMPTPSCQLPSVPSSIDGVCGTEKNTCKTGAIGSEKDTPNAYTWTCKGENFGKDAHCVKEKDMCVGPHDFGPHAKLDKGSTTWARGNVTYTLNKGGSGKACSYYCDKGRTPNSSSTACEETYVCLAYKVPPGQNHYSTAYPNIYPVRSEKECSGRQGDYRLIHWYPWSKANAIIEEANKKLSEKGYAPSNQDNFILEDRIENTRRPDGSLPIYGERILDKTIN